MRLIGLPESELADTLRDVEAERRGARRAGDHDVPAARRAGDRDACSRRRPASSYAELEAAVLGRATARRVFSARRGDDRRDRGRLLLGPPVTTVATAESCTGGLMAARLTDRPGSSAYVLGGVVVYSNEAKVEHAGVPAELIERFGAVSPEVAAALATGAAARFEADLGIGITGIAGPGRRDAGEAGGHRLPVRGAGLRADAGSSAPCACPATARRCASARRRSALHLLRRAGCG